MKNKDNLNTNNSRGIAIIKASVVGILVNIFLVIFKASIGFLSNSIAIILDAVNNLSDVLSSTVTIVGTKLSEKEADKEHPLGHGRIEYLSALIVASIILYAGVSSFIESFKKILNPTLANYNKISLIIIFVSIIVKILLGKHIKKVGENFNSQSLIASGTDALFDAVISSSVLISALIFIYFRISLEAYVGLGISFIIIKTGLEIFKNSIDDILGKRVDKALIKKIKKTICQDHNVSGTYDLMLHNYGPQKYVGSVHIEVPDTMTADKIDILEREIVDNIFEKYGVYLSGISIYSKNTKNPIITEMNLNILKITTSFEGVLQLHAFYVDLNLKTVRFDIVVDFSIEDKESLQNEIKDEIYKLYPDFNIYIRIDVDVDI